MKRLSSSQDDCVSTSPLIMIDSSRADQRTSVRNGLVPQDRSNFGNRTYADRKKRLKRQARVKIDDAEDADSIGLDHKNHTEQNNIARKQPHHYQSNADIDVNVEKTAIVSKYLPASQSNQIASSKVLSIIIEEELCHVDETLEMGSV